MKRRKRREGVVDGSVPGVALPALRVTGVNTILSLVMAVDARGHTYGVRVTGAKDADDLVAIGDSLGADQENIDLTEWQHYLMLCTHPDCRAKQDVIRAQNRKARR